MTANPFIKRLLGEAVPETAPPEQQDDMPAEMPPVDAAPEPAPEEPVSTNPSMQELAQQWQRGDHMAVASRLMFTEASYVDFVDLIFVIGHAAGRELGELLDELADSGSGSGDSIESPVAPRYQNLLQRMAGGDEEEDVL